jgi:hypothetical protein
MQKYGNKSGDSGILAFEIAKNFILIKFVTGQIYKYSYTTPGNFHVEQMKKLALSGKGLATYINQHVRANYEH